MLIGELARRTDTSERLLRYYERVGLLGSTRLANGYRDYGEDAVPVVARVRALLAAGLPTRLIRGMLPCTGETGAVRPCPGMLDLMRARLAELDRRAADLDAARSALTDAISSTEASAAR
ncbi:MerR family transcriptional regulator [Amycolatopsis sp. CA-230715]|uniref:MerR family transcriptional regulator n=1 Tax=Amycolatopsis sp. CA-230715 TaxID=2745196 RepID=UPI001C024A94|nr:MerR family transcriptional regulator [Amycolatopsis sp. CA-230715]QWF79428.1 hypothetical protein HUW46_02836 [Amycolatopsis sp. CA-230715]